MLEQNKIKAAKCGLAEYWAAGLDGRGFTAAVLDEMPYIREHMDREIFSAPLGEGSEASHATSVAQVLHEAAPGAKIVMLPFMNDADRAASIAWLQQNRVDAINMSLNLATADWCYPELEQLGVPIFAAAGNSGADTADVAKPACFDWTIAVGGIYEDGRQYLENSNGENMDCLGYTGVYIETKPGYMVPFGGTSCSSPWVLGMALCHYCGGKMPEVPVLREFIRQNCRDIGEAGKDRASGWGMLILPPVPTRVPVPIRVPVPTRVPVAEGELLPESEDDMMEIMLQIGSHAAWVNGECVALDCAPFASQGRTFVPLRAVAELLGCTVDYKDGVITIRA